MESSGCLKVSVPVLVHQYVHQRLVRTCFQGKSPTQNPSSARNVEEEERVGLKLCGKSFLASLGLFSKGLSSPNLDMGLYWLQLGTLWSSRQAWSPNPVLQRCLISYMGQIYPMLLWNSQSWSSLFKGGCLGQGERQVRLNACCFLSTFESLRSSACFLAPTCHNLRIFFEWRHLSDEPSNPGHCSMRTDEMTFECNLLCNNMP